jgi:hypothetical protein
MMFVGVANTPGTRPRLHLGLVLGQNQFMLEPSRKIFVIPFLSSS